MIVLPFMPMEFDHIAQQLIVSVVPILLAIILHEVAHGFVAYKLGDPTAKMMGRLTLNPLPHIDIFGTILMPLMLYIFTNGQFVFGYAKPVPINPYNFRNPKRDMAISSAGGPITNLLLAVLSTLLLKHVLIPASAATPDFADGRVLEPIAMMLRASILVNIVLAVFNMIPIPPLDGGRVLVGLLPDRQAAVLAKVEPFGFLIVIFLVATKIADYVLWPIMVLILNLISLL